VLLQRNVPSAVCLVGANLATVSLRGPCVSKHYLKRLEKRNQKAPSWIRKALTWAGKSQFDLIVHSFLSGFRTPCVELGEEAQFEGMVVDPFAGVLYAGQVSESVRGRLH
jgi:hypothetical protein